MGWRERPLPKEVVALASKVKSAKGLKGDIAEAAIRVAGFVEAVAREEKIGKSEAAQLVDEVYAPQGLYLSVIQRCIQYDA